jgi:transcriptional regulator GlxA family with amidase domain
VLTDVVVLAPPGVAPFELGVVCEVFGYDRSDQGLPVYDFAVVAAEPPPLTSGQGFRLDTDHRLDRVATADLVCIPAWRDPMKRPPEPFLEAVVAAVDRGARVLSVCTGAFVLAEAGLLDGRRATTHWRHAVTLAERYPAIEVTPDVLYVEAPLPLQRRAGTDGLSGLLDWAAENLHLELSVEDLARRAHMSPRTFARRFREATGTTPHKWVLGQRVGHAQRLLEQGLAVEEVARRAGFGSSATLRAAFARERGTSPSSYARTFAGTA